MQNHMAPTRRQVSDTILLTAFLAFSGGFQDAYTYIVRDHVFANAQTGNIVLMATKFLAGDVRGGARYLFPLFAFASGIFAAEQLEAKFKYARRLHWRQGILLLEIVLLGIVGFLDKNWNLQANMLVSFACAMQVQSFRKVNGNAYASTMCIGNLRSGTAAVSSYLRSRKKEALDRALYYFGVIFIFGLGAGVGGNLSPIFGIKAILFCPFFLIVGVVLMIAEER